MAEFEKVRKSVGEEVIKTTCYLRHGGCILLGHVKDGKLVFMEGDPDGPLNRGSICTGHQGSGIVALYSDASGHREQIMGYERRVHKAGGLPSIIGHRGTGSKSEKSQKKEYIYVRGEVVKDRVWAKDHKGL